MLLAILLSVVGLLSGVLHGAEEASRAAIPGAALPCLWPSPSDRLFTGTGAVAIAIEIEPAGIRELRLHGRMGEERPRALAVVEEGGVRYTNVGVQLKGNTSFLPIDDRPSLSLRFDRQEKGQRFHGLSRISLNNASQDPTALNEVLGRALFAAAGVPVPRAGHAVVTLNGRLLGLYVLTEGYDRHFLSRHFARTDGPLYEGGILRDIDSRPRLDSGEDPADAEFAEDPAPGATGEAPDGVRDAGKPLTSLERLIAAAREPDPARRYARLDACLDLDRFISMAAMETILCHSDSYSMNRNNYRLYLDPSIHRFVFMPHGMDRLLGTHRSPLDLSIVPPSLGLVSRALFSTEPGRRRYLDRLAELATNVFDPALVAARVRAMDESVRAEKLRPRSGGANRGGLRRNVRHDLAETIQRIDERAADLTLQLSAVAPHLRRPSFPAFDPTGEARLREWFLRPRVGAPPAPVQLRRLGPGRAQEATAPGDRKAGNNQAAEGADVLELTGTPAGIEATLCLRLTLLSGTYRLTGSIDVLDEATAAGTELSVTVVRGAPGRFQLVRGVLPARGMAGEFEVLERTAPEEVEMICEVRSVAERVRLNIGSLSLTREPAPVGERSRRPGDAGGRPARRNE